MQPPLHNSPPDNPPSSPSVSRPGWRHLLLEARAPLEFAAGLAAAPWLLNAPRGDGHTVLVYPGFLASDGSTRPLRRLLRSLGHVAEGWQQGRNMGPRAGQLERALQRIQALHHSSGRKLSLVGWSLGGLYARELAKQAPDCVRCVVTLGSPFAGPREATHADRSYRWLQRGRRVTERSPEELKAAPPVPTTSIFSRTDGIVAWPCSLEAAGPLSESIEVPASHLGLGVNPLALYALADRLAQPEGAWQPFAPSAARGLPLRLAQRLYPDPHRRG